MNYDNIKLQLANGIKYKDIALELGLPKSTLISRCIKAGIRSRDIFSNTTNKICAKCKVNKAKAEFYNRRQNNISGYCKQCTNQLSLARKHKLKEDCLKYKGGKCEECGYNKCAGALHFHHCDPTLKEFSISSLRSYTINDIIRIELDKCQVLCSNCHAEKHFYLTS